MRIPTRLGHFEKLGPLFKRNTTSSYWPNDVSKSKNAERQGTKRHKSIAICFKQLIWFLGDDNNSKMLSRKASVLIA